MNTQAYRTKLSEIFPIFTPRVLVLSPPPLPPPPPTWEASPSHATRPPPWQHFFVFCQSLVCIHFLLLKLFRTSGQN